MENSILACGGLAKQFDDSLSILAEKLSEHHDMAYSQLKMLMRVKVQFSIIRGVIRCIRGTRRRKTTTTLNMQDPFLRGIESTDVILQEAGIREGRRIN